MELNIFNGGLNLLKNERKIGLNECTDVVSADIASGSVASLPERQFVQLDVNPVFLEYQNKVVSADGDTQIARMHNQLFRSDGVAPRYTDGKLIDGRLKWMEMGIAKPTTTISVNIVEVDVGSVIYTYEEDATLMGALQKNYTYRYLFIIDGIPTTSEFTTDNEHEAHRLYIDYSNVVGTVTAVYRLVSGTYIEIKDSVNADKKFVDFDVAAGTYPFEKGTKRIVTDVHAAATLFSNISWSGSGKATVTFGVTAWTTSPALTLDFATGNHGNLVVDGVYTIGQVIKVVDDIRVDGMKKFIVRHDFGYWPLATMEIRHDGYYIKEIHASLVNTPRAVILDKSASYANGIGDSLLASIGDKDLRGELEYALTFETDAGVETAIGPISTIIHSDGQAINIIIPAMDQPSTDVNKVNLYRRNSGLYSGGTSFLYVKQFALADLPVTYTDNTKIEDLGRLMPPRTIVPLPRDVRFFTEHRGRLFCATKGYTIITDVYTPDSANEYPTTPNNGDIYTASGLSADGYTYAEGTLAGETILNNMKIVYLNSEWTMHASDDDLQDYSKYFTVLWSNLGRPNEWDGLNFLNVSHGVTGLCSISNGLVVYSNTTTYIILNAETSNFTYRKLSGTQGCINDKSIQEWNGMAICASSDGISIADGGKVQLVSYNKLGLINMENNITSSAVVGEDYFLLLKTGFILRMNLLDMTFSYIDALDYSGLGEMYGKLYATRFTKLYEIEFRASTEKSVLIAGDIEVAKRTMAYRTGKVTDNAISNLKEYDKVRVNFEGKGFCTVFIDDEVVLLLEALVDGVTTLGIPNEFNKGYSIQFEVTGVGKLHSIEYTLRGRENA